MLRDAWAADPVDVLVLVDVLVDVLVLLDVLVRGQPRDHDAAAQPGGGNAPCHARAAIAAPARKTPTIGSAGPAHRLWRIGAVSRYAQAKAPYIGH